MSQSAQNLHDLFVVLKPDMRVDLAEVSPELYDNLDKQYSGFHGHALIACHSFTESWGNWEMHPAGDEVVVLLSGAATMVLLKDGAEEAVELNAPGSYVVVPAGIWHTARVAEPVTMLFVTPGEGTQHAESPPDISDG